VAETCAHRGGAEDHCTQYIPPPHRAKRPTRRRRNGVIWMQSSIDIGPDSCRSRRNRTLRSRPCCDQRHYPCAGPEARSAAGRIAQQANRSKSAKRDSAHIGGGRADLPIARSYAVRDLRRAEHPCGRRKQAPQVAESGRRGAPPIRSFGALRASNRSHEPLSLADLPPWGRS